MKILVYSMPEFPVHAAYDFAFPVNQQVYWVTQYLQAAHDVTLIALEGTDPTAFKHLIPLRNSQERGAYETLKGLKDFKWEDYDLVMDFSVEKWSYKAAQEKNLHTLYVNHPLVHSYEDPPPLKYPGLTGVSRAHCHHLSQRLGVPVKHLPFTYLPKDPPQREDKGYLLYFGRIVKERGVHELIRISRDQRIPLLIAGEDRAVDQDYVHRILEQCDGHLIKYLGAVDESVKLRLLAEAHLLVLPYLAESDAYACLTLKAAATLHVPTVTLNIGATSELISPGVNGYLVEDLATLARFSFEGSLQVDYDPQAGIWQEALDTLIQDAVSHPW